MDFIINIFSKIFLVINGAFFIFQIFYSAGTRAGIIIVLILGTVLATIHFSIKAANAYGGGAGVATFVGGFLLVGILSVLFIKVWNRQN